MGLQNIDPGQLIDPFLLQNIAPANDRVMKKVAFSLLIQFGWSFPTTTSTMLSAIVSSPCLEPLNFPTHSSSCVCLHACCVCSSVISHTDSPLVAGEWFHIPLGNLCRTNSLQEWKGWEGGTTKGAKQKCREGRNLWWNNYPWCHCSNILRSRCQ